MSALRRGHSLSLGLLVALLGSAASAADRTVAVGDATIARGASGVVAVSLAAQGNENALGFSLTFDPALLAYSSYAAGAGAGGATINVNDAQKLTGKLGIMMALPAGQTYAAGTLELVRLTFAATAGGQTQTTPVGFADTPVAREISDAQVNVLDATYQGATITLQAPSGPCAGPYDAFIPAAAHTIGAGGVGWLTDLDLLNRGATEAHVDLDLLKANQANLSPQTASITVPPGRAVRLVDLLGTLLPASNAAIGIRNCAGAAYVNARFYNNSSKAGGTYGMYVPALGDARAVTKAARGVFHHLTYSTSLAAGYRVNIGFANAQATAVSLVVRLYGDTGAQVGTRNVSLGGYEHRQITNIYQTVSSPAVAFGSATVEVTTVGGKVHAYAMLIDNVSGDPMFMPPDLEAVP